MGTNRHRDRLLGVPPGTSVLRTKSGTIIGTTNGRSTLYTQSMDDVHGDPKPYPDHPLSSTITSIEVEALNGTADSGAPSSWVRDHTNFISASAFSVSHLSTDVPGISTADANTVAARSNPSRANIVPLTIVQDIVDLPRMIRDLGRTIKKPKRLMSAKELANHNLAAQFGWLPLIKDVQDILDFGQTVHKRAAELRKLYDRGWIGRTIQLDHGTNTSRSSSDVGLSPSAAGVPGIFARYEKSTQVSKWGSARWRLDVTPPYNPSDAEVLRQARRLASGLTPEGLASGVWEVLPWTWLLDWFTHTGDFIRSHSNTIPATLTSCCIMRKTQTEYVYYRTDDQKQVTGGEGSVKFDFFERQVKHPSPFTATLPHLTAKSLSILGSLFIQRTK